MIAYIVRRLFQMVIVLLGVTVITFGILFLIPGDPASLVAGKNATPEKVVEVRTRLGLDQPVPVQYVQDLGDHADARAVQSAGQNHAGQKRQIGADISKCPGEFVAIKPNAIPWHGDSQNGESYPLVLSLFQFGRKSLSRSSSRFRCRWYSQIIPQAIPPPTIQPARISEG